jgi:chemotaxis protein MotB
MAKIGPPPTPGGLSSSNSGSVLRPEPPRGKVRRFPWRLWLWAIVMTAAAGAGGYFTWHYRGEAQTATESAAELRAKATTTETELTHKATGLETELARRTTDLTACTTARSTEGADCKRLSEETKELAKNLNASKEELTQLRAQRVETEKRIAAVEAIQKKFEAMINTGTLKVAARRGSLVLSLPAEVLFPSGVAELSKEGEFKVVEIGVALKQFADRRFLVVGHSDNQPLKSSVYKDNWELSAARALSVVRILVQAGMDPKQLLPSAGGEHDPITPNTTAKEMARNRRIEIILMPAINELPPLPASLETKDRPSP